MTPTLKPKAQLTFTHPAAPEKTTLNSAEICAIIEACGKAQVKSLVLGDLRLRFFSQNPAQESYTQLPPARIAEADRIQSASNLHDELAIREAQETMALIEDPELYEQLQQAEAVDVEDDNRSK
jgi:hypothetical protein